MPLTVADYFADILAAAGVRRIYGPVTDGLAGITEALDRQGKIEWVDVRHAGVGALAASTEAHLTGNLAVCAGSWGAGNLDLINGLSDCHRSQVPVLAIATQFPSSETGSSDFNEAHPQALFGGCSHYCAQVSDPAQIPRALELGIRIAIGERGVSVIAIPQDLILRPAGPASISKPASLVLRAPASVPQEEELDGLARVLNAANRVTMLCGRGCAGAHSEIITLANKLKAPVVHTLKGKEHVEYNNPFDVGMSGPIGFTSGHYAMTNCDVLLMLGTDFPYRQFYPTAPGVVKVQIDIRSGQIGRRTPIDLGLLGHVKVIVAALLPKLVDKDRRDHLDQALKHYGRVRTELEALALATDDKPSIHPLQVISAISDFASEDAVFTCDAGMPTLWGARCLKMNGKRRLINSSWPGSTRDATTRAVGAQLALPGRQVISLAGGDDLPMLMGDLQRIVQLGLPVKIVVFNDGALGGIAAEQRPTSLQTAGENLDSPNFAAVGEAAGLLGMRLEDPAEVDDGIWSALSHSGPAVIDVVVGRSGFPSVVTQLARNSEVYMGTEVVNAQGNQLIDLANTSPWDGL